MCAAAALMYRVAESANAYHNLLMADSDIGRLDLVLNLDLPMLAFDVDRPRISAMGLSAKDVAETVWQLHRGFYLYSVIHVYLRYLE